MLEPNGEVCFTWLEDYATNGSMTLEEMNDLFTGRHIGGLSFISLLMLSGLVGNLMVMWVYGKKFKRSNYRTYTLWLAAMDLTNCCIGMPFLLLYHTHYITFPTIAFCRLGRFVLLYTANASSFILVVIGFDRYRRICCSLNKQISQLQAKIACCSVAVLAIFISWPNLILFGSHENDSLPFNITGTRCWEDDEFKNVNTLSDFYIGLCCLSFVVTIILFIFYSLIVKFLYKNKNIATNKFPYNNKSIAKNKLVRKTTLTLLIITAAYIFSALPHNVIVAVLLQIPSLHCHMSFKEGFVLYIFGWSNLINNSVNPLIYGFSDMRFKKELKVITSQLRKKWCICRNSE